jgi:hypothetical protein
MRQLQAVAASVPHTAYDYDFLDACIFFKGKQVYI